MNAAMSARFVPSAMLALLVGLSLQYLMQALIRTPPPVRATAPTLEVLRHVIPPDAPPPRTPTTTKPPLPVRPPTMPGDFKIPPATPPSPVPNGNIPEVPAPPSATFDPTSFATAPTLPDAPARLRAPLRPPFPAAALRREREGRVSAAFTVESDGRVSNVVIEHVAPRGLGFEQSVRRALRGARFIPASVDGQPASSRLRQDFVFELDK